MKNDPGAGAPRARRRRIVLLLGGLAMAGSCRMAGSTLHGGSASTAAEARQFLDALSARYTTPLRFADYDHARSQIAHNVFVPSNAWKDTSIWTARPAPGIRQVHAFGWLTAAGYRFRSATATPAVRAPGDSRHTVTLTRLGTEDVFRWETTADYHIGSLDPARGAATLPALFASAERRSERELRADYLGAFPRTAAALGRYASLDTLRTLVLPDGATAVRTVISLHSSRLARTYPALAAYLAKYTTKSRARFVIRDRIGTPNPATWLVLDARQSRITIDARVREGRLVPFHGPARALPDTLELLMDAVMSVGPTSVGFEQLRSMLVRTHTAQDHGWTIVAQREPSWRLPLFTERLIRTSLKRPFEGPGSSYSMGLRRDGEATVFYRHAKVTVQEGTILRFVNRLASGAFGDISPQVEAEEAAFLRTVFQAMRDDMGG